VGGLPVIRIGLIGDYDRTVTAHQAIPRALALAAERLGVAVEPRWIGTDTIPDDPRATLDDTSGLWCVPASPYRHTEGALAAIRYAREFGRPFLGTCGGFQHALLEYVRSVLGFADAAHAEVDPQSPMLLLAPLSCSLLEQKGEIELLDGTRIRSIYGVESITETYHCSYGLNPAYEQLLDDGKLRTCARDRQGEVRAVELSGHPFFLATLFQPERAALQGKEHPLVTAFVAACDRQLRPSAG
jgi:CTP synthase (UTP-ammonia lyase)